MKKKLIYLTTNPHKVEEANEFFSKKYGFNIEIVNPDFEILETQAQTCSEVAAFSAKYAADKLGCAVLKSDSGLYLDALGGLPGPYNHFFDKQIGIEKFLELLKNEKNRKARLEHCFAYCEPGKEPIVFSGGGTGTIAYEARGTRGRWHDRFYIPDGETKTLSELREEDYEYEASFWGDAKDQFARWYMENVVGSTDDFKYLLDKAKEEGIEKNVVGAIITNNQDEIFILTRKEDDFMGGISELPSGNMENGEDIPMALAREVKEETNCDIESILYFINSFDYKSGSGKRARQYNFAVKVKSTHEIILTEHDSCSWESTDEILNNSKITEEVKKTVRKYIEIKGYGH